MKTLKTLKLLLAIAVAVVAVLLVSSMVIAAPGSTTGVQTNLVFDNPIVTGTMPMTHPVGSAIALFFNIPYTQVMALHAEGFGFGTIARVYLTALASGGVLSPTQLLEMRQEGVGWGQIKKEFGVHPGGNGLGAIMGHKHDAPTVPPPSTPPEVKPGNNGSSCPGNSCNAPGQQNRAKGKPAKTH